MKGKQSPQSQRQRNKYNDYKTDFTGERLKTVFHPYFCPALKLIFCKKVGIYRGVQLFSGNNFSILILEKQFL